MTTTRETRPKRLDARNGHVVESGIVAGDDRTVVVAHDRRDAALADTVDTLARLGVVTDDVTRTDDEADIGHIREDSVQRDDIRVYVRDNPELHAPISKRQQLSVGCR